MIKSHVLYRLSYPITFGVCKWRADVGQVRLPILARPVEFRGATGSGSSACTKFTAKRRLLSVKPTFWCG